MMTIHTGRLSIAPLTTGDAIFIRELVNTEGWLTFIGQRNVHTAADAVHYIQAILDNPRVMYRVARLQPGGIPVGVITFIKRDYLDHHDIGFAFLPQFAGKGYAYEASNAVLQHILETEQHSHIQATTIPDNHHSIRLLEKLGLQWERALERDGEALAVYGASTEMLTSRHMIAPSYTARTGATGALLDEYERAIAELKKVMTGITDEDLVSLLQPLPEAAHCRSMQEILAHVVHAGYGYATSIFNLAGHNKQRPEKVLRNSIAAYQQDLDAVFDYTEPVFRNISDTDLEQTDPDKKIRSGWGQLYDTEQMMEHAIVHILRHRRQLERIKHSMKK